MTFAGLVAGVALAASAQAAVVSGGATHGAGVTRAANDCRVPQEWTDALSRMFADADYNLRLERDGVARPLQRLISNLTRSPVYIDENAVKGVGNTVRSLAQTPDLSGPVVNFINAMQDAPMPQCPAAPSATSHPARD